MNIQTDDFNPYEDINGSRQEIKEIMEELDEIAETDRQRMPEEIFVAGFLPLFAGEADKVPKGLNLTKWSNIAGGPFRQVDVIDRQGNVLFTVPALMDRSAFVSRTNDRINMGHIAATAVQYAHQSPALARNYIDEELAKRQVLKSIPAVVMQNLETWNTIFVRYNRPPLIALEPKDTKADEAKKEEQAHLDNYENWELL